MEKEFTNENEWIPLFGEKVLYVLPMITMILRENVYFLGVKDDTSWWVSHKNPLDENSTKGEMWTINKLYAEQIKQEVEYTMDEIAEKLGIPVEKLKIKK